MRRPVRRAGRDRRQEPSQRRGQSLRADAQGSRLRLLPHREREEPLRRGPAQAHRLLAGLRRRRRAGARRRRDRAASLASAVASAPPAHVHDFLPMAARDILEFEGCAEAWTRALASAGIALDDLSFVETHDCFTIAELIEYEAMGLVREGQGARAVARGLDRRRAAACRSIRPAGSRPRAIRSAPPACRCTCWRRCS